MYLFACLAKAALTCRVSLEGFTQGLTAEVGPVDRGEEELSIGGLPEQVVADTLLAPRTDQEVGIGEGSRVKVSRDSLLGKAVYREATFGDLTGYLGGARRISSREE